MTPKEMRIKACMQHLEEVLTFMRKDPSSVSATIHRLSTRFLSPCNLFESNSRQLMKENISEREAELLSLIPNLTRYALRSQRGEHPMIQNLADASEYLKTLYIGVPIEQFHLLCLDHSGRLIDCLLLQKGTVDQTPFYLRHLLQGVISSGAKAVVLSHNHPGGTLRPSEADIQCTLSALRALYPLRVMMLDHIIIADGEAVSIRDNGFINASLWYQQNPSNALLRHWIPPLSESLGK